MWKLSRLGSPRHWGQANGSAIAQTKRTKEGPRALEKMWGGGGREKCGEIRVEIHRWRSKEKSRSKKATRGGRVRFKED